MNPVLRALILTLFTLPAWAEVKVEMLNPPENAWSKQVDNVHRLKLKDALKTYQSLTQSALGEYERDFTFLLAANADEARQKPANKQSFILNLDRKQSKSALKNQPFATLGNQLFMAQLDELAQQKPLHEWLRIGSASWIGAELAARHGDEPVANQLQSASYWLRNSEEDVDPASIFAAASIDPDNKAIWNTTLLMSYYLREDMGARFLPALAAYAKGGLNTDQAFEQHFGRSKASFLQGYTAWATQIKTAKRQHKEAIPPASAYATLRQPELFPLPEQAAKILSDYRKARSPKALAVSTRGAWAFRKDSEDAMAQALATCRRSDPVSCRLYAVDNTVVYTPPVPGQAKIEVRMASLSDDGWTRDVREKFLPMAERSTEALRQLALNKMGVGFDETVLVHLTSGTDDYVRVLQEEMGFEEQRANDRSATSGGMSNSRGQIAIPVKMDRSQIELMTRVAKTPAHEAVHELQSQLAKRYRGFKTPAWICEGTANLFAYEAIDAAKLTEAEAISKAAWHQENIAWYKRSGTLQPEEILEPEGATWHKLMSQQRGPYQLAGLMAYRLQQLTGDKFYKAWTDYHRLASQPGQKEEAAFEQSFGLSRAAFLENYKAWVKTL